jgi:hypothetical protein
MIHTNVGALVTKGNIVYSGLCCQVNPSFRVATPTTDYTFIFCDTCYREWEINNHGRVFVTSIIKYNPKFESND